MSLNIRFRYGIDIFCVYKRQSKLTILSHIKIHNKHFTFNSFLLNKHSKPLLLSLSFAPRLITVLCILLLKMSHNTRHHVEGTVVLMKKSVLDFNDYTASFLDGLHEFVGKGVSLQLISAVNTDPG